MTSEWQGMRSTAQRGPLCQKCGWSMQKRERIYDDWIGAQRVRVHWPRYKKESVIYRNPVRWLEIFQSIWSKRERTLAQRERKKSRTMLEQSRNDKNPFCSRPSRALRCVSFSFREPIVISDKLRHDEQRWIRWFSNLRFTRNLFSRWSR